MVDKLGLRAKTLLIDGYASGPRQYHKKQFRAKGGKSNGPPYLLGKKSKTGKGASSLESQVCTCLKGSRPNPIVRIDRENKNNTGGKKDRKSYYHIRLIQQVSCHGGALSEQKKKKKKKKKRPTCASLVYGEIHCVQESGEAGGKGKDGCHPLGQGKGKGSQLSEEKGKETDGSPFKLHPGEKARVFIR